MSAVATTHKRSGNNIVAWKRRRSGLRQRLWDLLLSGDFPDAPKPVYQTIAEGETALDAIREGIRFARTAVPDQYQYHNEIPFEWNGETTWDTSIISYGGWPGEPAQRAVLRVPRGLTRPAPAVMCFHGHMVGCLLGKEAVNNLAIPLSARGFVTLSPDAIRWGDRRDRTYEDAEIKDWHGMSFYSERNLAMPLMLEGKTLLGAMIWEHMRAVDVLGGMKFVDHKRIGTIGWSMGAMQSFWLAAMDERIACGVEARGICSYKQWAVLRTLNALICFIPHVRRYTDMGEIGSLIAPRPFMCLDAASDSFFPVQGIKEVTRVMASTYRLYKQASRFETQLDPGGHKFEGKVVEDAFDWLSRWLMDQRTT